MNCYRRFNVDIMMLYISAMDHARKLKFRSYVDLPPIYEMLISLHFSDSVVHIVGEVIIFEHGFYISAWEHIRMLILSIYVIACINTIYKYGHA